MPHNSSTSLILCRVIISNHLCIKILIKCHYDKCCNVQRALLVGSARAVKLQWFNRRVSPDWTHAQLLHWRPEQYQRRCNVDIYYCYDWSMRYHLIMMMGDMVEVLYWQLMTHDSWPVLSCLHVAFPREFSGTESTWNHVGGNLGIYLGIWPFQLGYFV